MDKNRSTIIKSKIVTSVTDFTDPAVVRHSTKGAAEHYMVKFRSNM